MFKVAGHLAGVLALRLLLAPGEGPGRTTASTWPLRARRGGLRSRAQSTRAYQALRALPVNASAHHWHPTRSFLTSSQPESPASAFGAPEAPARRPGPDINDPTSPQVRSRRAFSSTPVERNFVERPKRRFLSPRSGKKIERNPTCCFAFGIRPVVPKSACPHRKSFSSHRCTLSRLAGGHRRGLSPVRPTSVRQPHDKVRSAFIQKTCPAYPSALKQVVSDEQY